MQRYIKEELHLTEEEFYQVVKGLFSLKCKELKLFVEGKEIWFFNKDKPRTKEPACDLIPVKGKKYLVYSSSHECWVVVTCDGYDFDKKCLIYGVSTHSLYYPADKPCPDVKVGDKVLIHLGHGEHYEAKVTDFDTQGKPVFYTSTESDGNYLQSDTWYLMN